MKKRRKSTHASSIDLSRGGLSRALRYERLAVGLMLTLHAALAIWGAAMNSVTFDENAHVPAGVVIVTRADFSVSPVNPPLVKSLCGLSALAAGARAPNVDGLLTRSQLLWGEAFMRFNDVRYHRIFFAARMVIVVLSVLLGLQVWRFARRLYGARGALIGLAFYTLSPEALAHAGVATMDVATALGFLASTYGLWNFSRTGRWRWWVMTALAVAFTALTRFTAMLLAPIFTLLVLALAATSQLRHPRRVFFGLTMLVPATLAALAIGYFGQLSFQPLSHYTFLSHPLTVLQSAMPWMRPPLPDSYLTGLDSQSTTGVHTFLLGKIRPEYLWYYFPLALLFKWPLGFFGALILRTGVAVVTPLTARRARDQLFLLLHP